MSRPGKLTLRERRVLRNVFKEGSVTMDIVAFVTEIKFDTELKQIEAKLNELPYKEIQGLYREFGCDHLTLLARKIYYEYKEKAKK